ncbi:MAG: hypothetical protein MMC33_000057 [Icmadophila ericetorum]|nr:hypothetical protein [Icmadophila ericetorum]
MSKIARKNQARQKQQIKNQRNAKSASVFFGQNAAPRNVAIVPLTQAAGSRIVIQKLNEGLDIESEIPLEGPVRVHIDRFKQNIMYMPVRRDLINVLDTCQVADFVIFVLSPTEEVDETGELLLRAIENQGVSNVLTVVHDLDQIEPAKRRPQILSSLKSYINHFFPTQEKVHSLDSLQDCTNVIRSLCTTTPKGVKWREDRTWMLVEEVKWPPHGAAPDLEHGEVVVCGVVRGKGLKANRLVQVGDWGTFQIEKITLAASVNSKKRKADEMAVDDGQEGAVLETPDEQQDDLADLALAEISMADIDDLPVSEAPVERRGVLLDDHHYFSDDETHLPEAPKRLPKGTSSYQAAWFLGDMSESDLGDDEDMNDVDGDVAMDTQPLPQDGLEGLDQVKIGGASEFEPSEYPQSEMFLDPAPEEEAAELEAYRSLRNNEAAEDAEFPDEIELHPNVLARERLAKYRGLKSLRTSTWETGEDKPYEPEGWNRLLQISNYKGSKNKAINEALVGGVQPGTRVNVHLRQVPLSLQKQLSSSKCLTLFSLLRHERKQTVMHFSITLQSDYPAPIKSKTELVMQCGPRRFRVNPLFANSGNTPNNVHKFNRYLHPGQTAIATFITPLTWGSVPTLFFKSLPPAADGTVPKAGLELVATGTSQAPDQSRVVAKRVILTGHPYKIHKKLVTVRYMFFNFEDVNWFKALQLWTKRGRSGYIKESLGTHGYFKATFDGKINPQDAVGVSLYKRVFPRTSKPWRPEEVEESKAANIG